MENTKSKLQTSQEQIKAPVSKQIKLNEQTK